MVRHPFSNDGHGRTRRTDRFEAPEDAVKRADDGHSLEMR
jgi:hypothetical protein